MYARPDIITELEHIESNGRRIAQMARDRRWSSRSSGIPATLRALKQAAEAAADS
jgi:hypothetical protein